MLPLKRIPLSLPRPARPALLSLSRTSPQRTRQFTSTPQTQDQNRIYTPVRYPADLATYISTSTSTAKPLLTLWTTSYCSSCKTVAPLMRKVIEEGVGEKEGGVLFVEVEYDAPDVMGEGLGLRYMVRSVPTLVGFWRGEVMGGGAGLGAGERLGAADIQRLGREGLEEWVRGAASRGREWREGHPGGEGLFGGLWKGWGK